MVTRSWLSKATIWFWVFLDTGTSDWWKPLECNLVFLFSAVEFRHDREEKGSINVLYNWNGTNDILASQKKGASISIGEEVSLKLRIKLKHDSIYWFSLTVPSIPAMQLLKWTWPLHLVAKRESSLDWLPSTFSDWFSCQLSGHFTCHLENWDWQVKDTSIWDRKPWTWIMIADRISRSFILVPIMNTCPDSICWLSQ